MRIQVERDHILLLDEVFTERTIYLGRAETCQVVLAGEEGQIAARHAVVFEENGQWFVETLHDQYHQTQLAGHFLKGKSAVEESAELTIGEFRILVSLSEKNVSDDRAIAVQVIARRKVELQDNVTLSLDTLGLKQATLVKTRTETASVSRGWMERITSLPLRWGAVNDVRVLMNVMLEVLYEYFEPSCAWIGLRTDGEGHLHLSAGRDPGGRAIDMPALAKESQKAVCEFGRSVLYQSVPSLGDRSAMAASLISPDGSLGMVYVESSSSRATKFSVPDLDALMFAAMQMASGLDQVLRDQTEMIARKISQNQEMSRKVQQRIAPWKLPQWPGLAVGVFSESGKNECTDFYDIVPNGQEQGVVLIGRTGSDESDSALSMAEIGSAFRIGAVHRVQPQVMLRLINWVIYGYRNEPRKISAGALSINPDSGEFSVSLVGDIHGWVIGDSGKVTKIGRHTDVWIGQARKSKFDGVQGKLKTGESIVLFTEGIFKLRAPDGRVYGREQFEESLSDSSSQPLSGVMSDLVSEIKTFTGGEAFASDMTVVMLRKQ